MHFGPRHWEGDDQALLENLVSGSDWFGKHGFVCGKRFRNGVQVLLRNRDVFGERSVVPQNSQDGSIRAVCRKAGSAGVAFPATAVNFSDDAPASEAARFCDAYKFVAENSFKTHVPLNELQIGLANSGSKDANQYFAWLRFGRGILVDDVEAGA